MHGLRGFITYSQYHHWCSFLYSSGWITSQRGEFKDHFKIAPRMKQHNTVAVCYFIIALMMAGLPPFSGFLGKVFLLQATANSPYQIMIILIVLLVSLLVLSHSLELVLRLSGVHLAQKMISILKNISVIRLCRIRHRFVMTKPFICC